MISAGPTVQTWITGALINICFSKKKENHNFKIRLVIKRTPHVFGGKITKRASEIDGCWFENFKVICRDPISFRHFGYLENRMRENGARIGTLMTQFKLSMLKGAQVVGQQVEKKISYI